MSKPGISLYFAAVLCSSPGFAQPRVSEGGVSRTGPPLNFRNSPRVHELIRAGGLYLSLADALELTIENNLDIELERYTLLVADTDLLRARGGGTVRGMNFTLAEAPTGVGGPLSPVLTNPAATGSATAGSSVTTNALELGVLGSPQTNLSMQGTIAQSNGTSVPVFDPAIVGQLNWTHQTTPQSNSVTTGTPSLIAETTLANAGIQRGFSTGAVAGLMFNNSHQALNSLRTAYNPYTGSNLGLNVSQPLLRGFGLGLNRRFIRIAGDEQKIGGLLFQQQLIASVYGVIRLYTDFVALYQDVKVKQESVMTAERLLSDVSAQVEEGTLAPVEQTRANAQVFSTRQDLANSQGLLEEQEAILKNVLTRQGNEDLEVRSAHIIPTDTLEIPAQDNIQPIQDLVAEALANRPDLRQARLQIDISKIGLQGSKNATLPEVDLLGVVANSGLAGALNPLQPSADPALIGGFGGVLDQILSRRYPTYGIGLQLNLPLRNRIAEADFARDQIQVKQSEVRLRQLENQARLEVEDAIIALRRARASADAAAQARQFQQESLAVEQAKFDVGASTGFFVIQYQSLLAQAQSTEVAAKSAYVKARAALERAIGSILTENGISVDAALKGTMR